jgi:prephenate dehydratase
MPSRRTPPPLIAFQGQPGAYSDLACRDAYPRLRTLPCPTFEDAFAAVQRGRARLAMIPIENSSAGRVADVHHLMPASGLHIIGEYFQPVRHQLLGVPGATLRTIRSVESHVQALDQCRALTRRLRLRRIVATDTAGSAAEVARVGDPSRAAIASALAARIYGLRVLQRDVEDNHHNTTRMVVLSRTPRVPRRGSGRILTSFVFQVRNVPAALYKAMGGFATNGINMTKLESYMLEGRFTATQFYADVEGHPAERPLRLALEELAFFTKNFKLLGVYPAHPYRDAQGGAHGE